MSAILTNVYNHYLTSYAPKGTTPYDAHKRSELRSIHNSIIKLNKEAPWYLPDTRKETPGYAISIKEGARTLRNTITSLSGLDETGLLSKKVAYSSDDNIVQASYIGDLQEGGGRSSESLPLEIEVKTLAAGQENLGIYLPNEKTQLEPNVYSFDIGIRGINYEFQFHIKENETNRSVQERLARLINNADIGLNADLQEAGSVSSLRLTSGITGSTFQRDSQFVVSDDHTSKTAGAVAYFGLNYVSKQPTNATFLLNGEEQSASSNNFTLGKLYEINLKGISPQGKPTQIGLKNDVESMTHNITQLIDGYNSFLQTMRSHTSLYPMSDRLVTEMGNITSHYKNELDAIGLTLQEDNSIKADSTLLRQSAEDKLASGDFSGLKNFAHSLVRKTAQISLNPMQYVDRTVVAYKNPGRSFVSPYTPTAYSGMIFNSYC